MACGLPVWSGTVSQAQTQINITGASLVRPAMNQPYLTNDFIDVDNDGRYGFNPNGPWFVDQLAPTISSYQVNGAPPDGSGNLTPTYVLDNNANNVVWLVNYRGVGSVNGLKEFTDWHLLGILPTSIPGERGYLNRDEYANAGSWSSAGGKLTGLDAWRHPSGSPVAMQSIDIAVLDVPVAWAVRSEGTPAWNRKPGQAGYGQSPVLSNTGWSNQLASLSRTDSQGQVRSLNTNTRNPDANTIFNTNIAFVPVVVLLNHGVGMDGNNDGVPDGNVRYTDLQYLYVTGRMQSGENLVAATRSAGSGTHNAMFNSIGVDPSWARGDNLGNEFIQAEYGYLGTGAVGSGVSFVPEGVPYQPTFAETSSGVEEATRNHRLAVGYTGLAGRASHWNEGRYEIANVMKNIDTNGDGQPDSNVFIRPTIPNIVNPIGGGDPSDHGYEIGGNAVFVSRGNPFETDPNSPAYMSNQAAAAFLRNIQASIEAYSAAPANVNLYGSPGQGLGTLFILPAGLDRVQSETDGTVFIEQTPNLTLQNEMLAKIDFGMGPGVSIGDYGTSGEPYGRVPRRKGTVTGVTYSDGVTTIIANGDARSYVSGGFYRDVDGNNSDLNYGAVMTTPRNAIAGDFGGSATWSPTMGYGDGQRNLNDIPAMMQAIAWRLGSSQVNKPDDHDGDGVAGTRLCLEIIGDFDGDGNFTPEDVRYFADGLAMTVGTPGDYASRKLNRKAGFIAADTHWTVTDIPGRSAGNFFGTQLSTGKPYQTGDSRGDVAGRPATPGAAPTGWDGWVDAQDVQYVYDQFLSLPGRVCRWATNLDHAALSDLSADMNGDLQIDIDDVKELVLIILRAQPGDFNLDGRVDLQDYQIYHTNRFGTMPAVATYPMGDANFDFVLDASDFAILQAAVGGLLGDTNFDGVVDLADYNNVVNNLGASSFLGDTNADGIVDLADYNNVVNNLGSTAPVSLAVPEPASLVLIGLAGLLIGRGSKNNRVSR